MSKKKFTLTRIKQGDKATLGKLFDERKSIVCYTLELPWKNNTQYISCIPEGVYQCAKFSGGKFQDVWQVLDVIGRTYILFHNGNFLSDIEGCILVGKNHDKYKGEPIVNDSVNTLNRMRQSMPDEFTLEIKCVGFSNSLCEVDPIKIKEMRI